MRGWCAAVPEADAAIAAAGREDVMAGRPGADALHAGRVAHEVAQPLRAVRVPQSQGLITGCRQEARVILQEQPQTRGLIFTELSEG